MQWAKSIYGVHLIVAPEDSPEMCRWENWQLAFPIVDALLELSPDSAAIRTGQTFDRNSKWLRFGRMIWNRRNNEKWTQKYRAAEYADRNLRFSYTEIWAPDWNVVYRERRAPDVYVKLKTSPAAEVRQTIIVAVREPIYSNSVQSIRESVDRLAQLLPASRQFAGLQRWAERVYEGGGYSNGLSDRSPIRVMQQLVPVDG